MGVVFWNIFETQCSLIEISGNWNMINQKKTITNSEMFSNSVTHLASSVVSHLFKILATVLV